MQNNGWQRWAAIGGILGGVGVAIIALVRRPRSVQQTMTDRVVIVTGASSGIGRATAIAFAERGAHLVLVARRVAKLAQLADEIANLAASTLVIAADVSNSDDLERVVEDTEDAYGRVDVLINNAGVSVNGRFERIMPADIGRMVDVNLYGPMYLTQLVLPIMRGQGRGHIINVSSVASTIGLPGQQVYGATKAGLNAFTTSLRRELSGTLIKVNNVLPGYTRTSMVSDVTPQTLRTGFLQAKLPPVGTHVDEPETIAQVIVKSVEQGDDRDRVVAGPLLRLYAHMSRAFPRGADSTYANADRDALYDMLERITF